MRKGATTEGANNKMRPDADDYFSLGYVPLREQYDNSVSHALEYYIADYALSRMAKELGKTDDANLFYKPFVRLQELLRQNSGLCGLSCPTANSIHRSIQNKAKILSRRRDSMEGNSWNYTFYVPHDINGLAKAYGRQRKSSLTKQSVFDNGYYDPANEPDIAYPFLFSNFKRGMAHTETHQRASFQTLHYKTRRHSRQRGHWHHVIMGDILNDGTIPRYTWHTGIYTDNPYI